VDAEGWIGLALAAVDFGFRDNLAVDISPDWMVRWIAPRGGWLRAVCSPGLAPQDRPEGVRPWSGPKPQLGNPSRLHRLIYALLNGDWEDRGDQDRAGEVLAALWTLITSTVARDVGRGAWRLDFRFAAVARLKQGWLCPVTRRVFGYSPAGRSPYDPARRLASVDYPQLPIANAGGLAPDQRVAIRDWCRGAPEIALLRAQGLWTNLHDRSAEYAPFLRAQEHSAQIDRPVLQIYEQRFKDGRINILNCTTTMEMGVDIPNVALVVNANVPPSVSNYRQRVGRAGRRDEAFAFAVTFCRDLPWDEIAFAAPPQYLAAPIAAPSVRLDSPALVARHVHAALLGAFLRGQPDGFNIRTSIGAFFGAAEVVDEPVAPGSPVEAFIASLNTNRIDDDAFSHHLAALTRGTVLASRDLDYLAAETAESLETLLGHWRAEYRELLERAAAAAEPEVQAALSNRAKRMRGEFLLGELARRGFTPAYGFPVDVVSFDHLSGRERDRQDGSPVIAYGERRGGASRTLDVAIREYAPGAEVVVDGLVHLSEGVLPAWGALSDASGLEDLQHFWECGSCRAFGLTRLVPDVCPSCEAPAPQWRRTLRPAGFLGRRAPHSGYESLGHVPYQMPRIRAASAPWQALPGPEMGRLRADPVGQVITLSSGAAGCGYALCLLCGRAEAEDEETTNATPAMPDAIRRHTPLASGRSVKLVGGYCPGGLTEPQRIQHNLRFVHDAQTDVFELQLPVGAKRAAGLAVAAALREALAERLGTEVREIGLALGTSTGPAGEARVSIFLHDRAAGGAGLVTRLAEPDWFSECVARASERLNCPQECSCGCPSCVLRPDLNFTEQRLDRPGGLALVTTLRARLDLPDVLRVLGPETRTLGHPLPEWLDRQRRAGALSGVTFFLHGQTRDWELAAWPIAGLLARLQQAGATPRLVVHSAAMTDAALDMAQKLDLHRLAAHASLLHAPKMPIAGEAPVLAVVELQGHTIAIASADKAEAIPGPTWGLGARTALVRGPAPPLERLQEFDSERLVKLSAGNARLVRLADRLNGSVGSFGRFFWNILAAESPLTAAAIKAHGVLSTHYTDRYLISPLSIRLLFEVLSTMPGVGTAQVNIATARLERPERLGWTVFHSFSEDGQRRQLLQALLPKANIELRAKADLPHARSLTLILRDGRRIALLLDQGFGAWRTEAARHDFRADAVAQARALRAAVFKVHSEPASELPMVVEERPGATL
jgi:DEAD/DEAH box helicase domain-containing protein